MPSFRCLVCGSVTVGILSLVLLGIGIGGSIFIDDFFHAQLRKNVVVDSPSSPGYAQWETNTSPGSAPQWMKFYVFNITNPEDVMNGELPHVQEFGPFAYREYEKKFNISFSGDQNTVTWQSWKYYVYDSESSFPGADPQMLVTIPNLPLQGVIGGLSFKGNPDDIWWQTMLAELLAAATNSSLFTTVTVNELIFGYEDPLLKLVSSLQPGTQTTFGIQPNQTSMDDAVKVPPNLSETGNANITEQSYFLLWRNKSSVECWGSDKANRVTGGDATKFWPGINSGELPVVWIDSLFRTGLLYSPIPGQPDAHPSASAGTYVMDPLGAGITLMQFQVPPQGLWNASMWPDNADYFQFGLSGVGNLTSCQKGAPVFMSKPHFLDADPWFGSRIVGLHPDASKHNTIVNVEPITGLTMQASKKLQVNLRILSDFGFLYPKVIPDLYIPMIWICEEGQLTQAQADQFVSQVYGTQKAIQAIRWVGIGLGSALVICTILLVISAVRKRASESAYVSIQ